MAGWRNRLSDIDLDTNRDSQRQHQNHLQAITQEYNKYESADRVESAFVLPAPCQYIAHNNLGVGEFDGMKI